MITRILQLLLVAGVLAGLVVYGFIRDKREHSSSLEAKGDAQESLAFPGNVSSDHDRRGSAMSRL